MAKGKPNQRSRENSGSSSSGNQNQNQHQSPSHNKRSHKDMLTSDLQNYRDTLKAYYRYMQQLPPQREWMKHKFGLRIRDIFDAKKDIKVLAVGTGAGDVDIDFLNEIIKCGKERLGENGYSVTYHVVEPNSVNVETFRNTVNGETKYHRITFKWCTGTFEKFCEDFKGMEYETNKFDFVHFVRCFYHTDSMKGFDRTYNHLLARNGIMCAVGENENAFWPKMMHFLASHKMEHECFKCSGPVSENYFLPGWIKLARDRDWRYESYVHGYNFDITPMYDPSSRDGNYILDFAMHVKSARRILKKNVVEDFFRLLDKSKVEKLYMRDNQKIKKIYFPCELGAIMITRE